MKTFLTKLFVRNFRYKLFAFLLAMAIWHSMTLRSFEDVLVGPIDPRFNMPPNFRVNREALEKVYLTLNCPSYIKSNYQVGADQFMLTIVLGPKTIEEKELIASENYTMTIPVSLHKGLVRSSLPLHVANLVNVESIRPSELDAVVSLIVRKVPLIARVRGNPQDGYVAGRPELLSLKEIELTGAPDTLEQVESVDLEAIDVSGLTRDVTRQVEIDGLALEALNVRAVREADRKVYIRIPVERAAKPLKLTSVPVLLRGGPTGATVTIVPDSLAIELEGRPSVLGSIDPGAVFAEVDLSGFGPGNYELPPAIKGIPEEVLVKSRSASVIEVKIELSGTAEELIEGSIAR